MRAFGHCSFDESSLSIGRVKLVLHAGSVLMKKHNILLHDLSKNTNMTRFRWFSKCRCPCALDKSTSLSIGRVNIILVNHPSVIKTG